MKLSQILHGELLLERCNGALKECYGGSGEHNVINIKEESNHVGAMTVVSVFASTHPGVRRYAAN